MVVQITKNRIVPRKIQEKWSTLINDLAVFIDVDVTFITKIHDEILELFIVNKSLRHDYKGGEKFNIHGHYCEETIKNNSYHLVTNYLNDPTKTEEEKANKKWLSYLGFPLRWPDQEIYGTICCVDRKPTDFTEGQIKFFQHFQELVEAHLELIYKNEELETMFRDLKESKEKIGIYERITPMCSVCKKIKNNDGNWKILEEFINESTGNYVSHGYCPTCYANALKKI
ncbi:GAF domain-containing protein [Candidatus Lokiarchaeum ossiferum]|uniref:GAF domain-containing protein n=1 Tax=Candidatus Lokiarchaeum ossiferum TaxID=2951803 RepID=UPI00352CD1B7